MRKIKTVLAAVLSAALLLAQGVAQNAPPAPVRTESELLTVLRSDAGRKEKADACRELAIRGGQEAIPVLVPMLSDENLSHMARYALERIPQPAVDKALRESLAELRGGNLVGVIHTIGVRKDAKAVKPLQTCLNSSDPEVARAAALALGRIGGVGVAQAMLKRFAGAPPKQQLALAEGILNCADALLGGSQAKAARGLFDALLAAEAPHQVKTAALRGAVLARGKDGPAFLAPYLRADADVTFGSALRVSRGLAGPEMTGVLIRAMKDARGDRKVLLVQTLGMRGDRAATPALIQILKENDAAMLKAAMQALAQLEETEAVPAIMPLLLHPEAEVRSTAKETLGSLPGPEVDAQVIKLTTRPETDLQIIGMDLIVRRRMVGALPVLLDLARSADEKVRLAAVGRTGELAGSAGAPEMLKLLLRARTPAEIAAAEQGLSAALLKAEDRNKAAGLAAGAWSVADVEQKMALLNVLASLGGTNALQAVRSAISSDRPEIRSAAIRALGAWNSAEAAPDLLQLAQSATDPVEKVLSLRSYLALATDSDLKPDARLDMCRQASALIKTPEEEKLLLSTLGNVSTMPALKMAQAHLANAAVKEEAANAVLRIAEKLLQARGAGKTAKPIIEALGSAASATANESVKTRAAKLQEVARAKAQEP